MASPARPTPIRDLALTRLEDKTEADLIRRLRRIEGQTRGLQAMIEAGRSCPEVLQQIAAVEAALRQVALRLTQEHVANHIAVSDDPLRRSQMTDELMRSLEGLVR